MYILGNTFMMNYYVVFDAQNYRIGLVPSKILIINSFFNDLGLIIIGLIILFFVYKFV